MISQAVEDRLIEKVGSITDVTVHIDPEDDEEAVTCRGLPLRNEAQDALEVAWREVEGLPAQREVRLHYLGGQIDAELILPLASFVDQAQTDRLRTALRRAGAGHAWFRGLEILYR
jgi:hypothetical protein